MNIFEVLLHKMEDKEDLVCHEKPRGRPICYHVYHKSENHTLENEAVNIKQSLIENYE